MKENIGFIDDEFDLESLRNVPTAEEFLTEKGYPGFAKHTLIKEWMKEFAKLHVEAALKAASESESDGTFGRMIYPNSILTCYPIENID